MGGSPSKLPPIIQRDPLPTAGAFVGGIQVGGDTQGCKYCSAPDKCGPCRLAIAQGTSASSAQLYREHGTISARECGKFAEDSEKVRNKEMSLEDFKANLAAGRYYERQDNGFCAQLVANSADLAESTTIDSIPWSKVRRPKIRKLTSSGGYSSITKLYIKPAIPFRVTFNGQSMDVSVMTLFHPSPVRIENVQHDAVLTLGDAGDSSAQMVIMIPLAGTVSPGPSSEFIGRIASYIPGVLRPNPASGLYESISAPTGKDWNLSTMFSGTPSSGETVVSSGYFAWASAPPMEEYEKARIIRPFWFPDTIQYGWRPTTNQSTQFVMLKEAFPISTYDLQSIRMLPVTPSEEAIPPILPKTVVYNTATECSSAPPSGAVKETYANSDETCDPFAYIPTKSYDEGNTIAALVISGLVVGIGILLALYFALKAVNSPTIPKVFKGWGNAVGDFFAKIAAGTGGPAAEGGPATEGAPALSMRNLFPGAEQRLAPSSSTNNPMIADAEKKAAEAEKKRVAAEAAEAKKKEEAEAKKKAETEAAEAKKKADEEAKKKADEEAKKKEEAEAAEEDKKLAERRAARNAMSPEQKAKKALTDAKMQQITLNGNLQEQTSNLEMYKQRYDDANKAGDRLAADTAKDSMRETRNQINALRGEISNVESEIRSAESQLASLKKAEDAAAKLTAEVNAQLDAEEKELKRLLGDSPGVVRMAKRTADTLTTSDRDALKKALADYESAIVNARKARQQPLMSGSTEQARAHNKRVADAIQDATANVRKTAEVLQDAVLKAPADGGPITQRTSEEDAKHKAILKRTTGFRGAPADTASTPPPASASAPAAQKKRVIAQEEDDLEDIEAKRKAAQDELDNLKESNRKLTLKSRTFLSGKVENTEEDRKKRIKELETILKDLEKSKSELETADKNLKETQTRLQQIKSSSVGNSTAVKAEEKKVEKTKEEIEAEKEKVEREYKASQERLKQSRITLTRAQQGRNIYSGRGKRTQRRRQR